MNIKDAKLQFRYTPGYRNISTELILHHAAGTGAVEGIHNYHLSLGWAGIAYHYYIRKNGEVWRGRPENWLGGHTTNHSSALGICFEGNFETDTMPDAQVRAGRELVADILGRYQGMKVYKHRDFNTTACPGARFPFDAIANPPTKEPADTDVEVNKEPSPWAKEACDKAVARGVFKGDETGFMDWQGNVTREQLAVILARVGALEEG